MKANNSMTEEHKFYGIAKCLLWTKISVNWVN